MKIMIPHPFNNVSEGLAQVWSSVGQSVIWDTRQPIYDALEKTKPDLILCNRQHLRNTVTEALKEYNVEIVILDEYDIKPAANLAYNNIQHDDKYSTEIFYYSQDTTPEQMIYLQEIINRQYQLKIIGNKLPLSSYLGMGNPDDIIKFMKSCKIAIAFDIWTLHTYAANKVFCLAGFENKLFPYFFNNAELMNALQCHLFDDGTPFARRGEIRFDGSIETIEKNNEYIENAHNYITTGNTFFHRANDLFTQLGHTEQADKCLAQLKLILNKMK